MSQKTKIHTVYKLADRTRVPSVTTFLGILGKPALLDWAWRCGCEGLDYKAVRDQAGDIGTLAHYLILCHLKNETPDTSEYSAQNIDKAKTCFLKYLEWEKAHTVKSILVEMPMVSELFRFGGTPDYLAYVDDVITLVDFKTGKAIYEEHFYQVAAYRKLAEEVTGHKITNARILRIGRDESEGFEERVMGDLSKEWQIFTHCMAIYRLQRKER